ncbi:acyl-CoA carboxylase subunit beta [Actinokineospora iranica]|uniref:Acetyl-CoA/propionyl-CoA carboxylase carboxyl transferase subunit n=1 Tax=Actinokineospora iranica TaxID=1271860 RepID=A0A1G6W6N7_9PSEU|nr:carboxyl transferase domain-containing protein [Actinokineospora iranica]SDD61610.1 acetyl-CoA/propionyl-CoA carboxylase carboxyl transferase subunit [Actinokineospora iranica]
MTRDPLTRIRTLLDPGHFRLLQPKDDCGVLAARGTVEGEPVFVYCTDATRMGGAMGTEGCRRIVHAIESAVAQGVPVVGLWHSGGARLAEGVVALDAVGKVFHAMVQASGRVPQISVVLGPAAGGAAYGPALTDVVVMSGNGRVFVTGPEVVRSVTGEVVDQEQLGGAEAHGRKSGVVHVTTADDESAISVGRNLAALLGRQGCVNARLLGESVDLGRFLPERANRAYPVKPLVDALLDAPGIELHPRWAPNINTTLGRFSGRTVGVVANNPLRLGGCLDATSGEKAARFVRMCDAFGIPLIVLVDVPGYLPGVGQEWGGVVRRGAKLLHAFAEATVPRVTIITRKAYGGAYLAMNARSMGAHTVLAWPTAEVAVMGAEAAVNVLHRKALAATPESEREAVRVRLVAEQRRSAGGVDTALRIGAVDDVIEPMETRKRIAAALIEAGERRGRHGNIPL